MHSPSHHLGSQLLSAPLQPSFMSPSPYSWSALSLTPVHVPHHPCFCCCKYRFLLPAIATSHTHTLSLILLMVLQLCSCFSNCSHYHLAYVCPPTPATDAAAGVAISVLEHPTVIITIMHTCALPLACPLVHVSDAATGVAVAVLYCISYCCHHADLCSANH